MRRTLASLIIVLVLGFGPRTLAQTRDAASSHQAGGMTAPIVELSGDSLQMGTAHGNQLGQRIRLLHRDYFGKLFANAGERDLVIKAANSFEPFLLPEHRDEINAMAKSSGLDVREIMLAQCFLDVAPAMGCSTITLPSAASPDGVARFARNLDFPSYNIADRHSVILAFQPKDRYAFVAVTWPGMVGVLSGMNEHGLTLANMEVGRQPREPGAMPYMLLYRMLLERCKTVDDAIATLQKTPRQSANNLMLMDASGARAVAEITPSKVTVRRAPDTAALISTNHQRGKDLDQPGRCDRFDALHQAAAKNFGRLSEPALEKMLARVAAGDMTIQSMVFEPANRVAYLAFGSNAPRQGFTRLDLKPYLSTRPAD